MVEILRITYYLYEFKRTKQGEVPIYCKLTTDGINRQQFSTRLYIRPEIWDKDAQCVRAKRSTQRRSLDSLRYF